MLHLGLTLALVGVLTFAASECESGVFWEIRDMVFCGGHQLGFVQFDGKKSIVEVPGDGAVRQLAHGVRHADLTQDTFVMEFGKLSPSIRWELGARPHDGPDKWLPLLKGKGGGTHKVRLSDIGLPRWAAVDIVLKFSSDKPGTMEIKRWAVLTPGPTRFGKEHAKAAKRLAKATPLERGIVPHWNPIIGGFVCAYNATHPEHYNYWLEDEGEQLWSFGNYPKMMKLYGKPMRDFIVKHTKVGAPVRRVNDQPLKANHYLKGGKFDFDTGLLWVTGDLSKDPQVELHHSAYETGGILARLGDFFVEYKTPDGATSRLDIAKPTAWSVDYNTPRLDNASLTIESSNAAIDAKFTIDVFRARTTVSVEVTNKTGGELRDLAAGFALRDCRNYYRSPINRVNEFSGVALLFSEQHDLENCNVVRVAGQALRPLGLSRKDDVIERAEVSASLARELAPTGKACAKVACVNAGSTSFFPRIDDYKYVDFEDADISMSFVGTYALLGLATYSYRFPEDKEARAAVDTMIGNFLDARDRARSRELAYLLWVLALYGRDKDAGEIADLLEKREEGRALNSLDGSAISMGLRCVGRWAKADQISNQIEPLWEFAIAPPTDLLGMGALQSPATRERAYLQLTRSLRQMYWDEPTRLTAHNDVSVEEGPQETNCYMLVAFDIFSRLYGGIVPIRIARFGKTLITDMVYCEVSGEWKLCMKDAGEVDVFTHFRPPKSVTWQGKALAKDSRRYSAKTGVIYVKGLSGDGELVVVADSALPKGDPAWPPIDYIGLSKKPK